MAAFLEALNENVAEESNASNTNPTPVVSTEPIRRAEEDDDDYDPSALVTPNLPVSAEKNTSTTTGQQNGGVKKQARVKGGFVIEDDDEDDGDVHNSSTNGLLNGGIAASSDLRRSLTGTPSNANVSLQKTEDSTQDNTTGASLNAPSVPSDSRAISSTPHPPVQSPSLATASDVQRTASISLPKVRLPQDRVGQLEDRIAEDPRGDVDAWLELINEHRIKNRLDDARAVYKRLFALFPSAVRSTQFVFEFTNSLIDIPMGCVC
jgi:cleavage stimulation factor subunit 3